MDAILNWTGHSPADAVAAFQDFQDVLPEHLEAAAEELALRIEATAKRLVNVDTGRLRASIDHEVERIGEAIVRASIGSNVDYAPLQEFDYPYLRPAIEEHRDTIEKRFGQAIQDAWDEVT